MEQKDTYTLGELFTNLTTTMTELKIRSGISDVTLASIRDGNSARRSTINKLLHAFSEIYKIPLSQDNVSGIVINDKIARMEAAKSIAASSETPQKRAYTTSEDIPTNWTLCSDFFEGRGIKETTYRRWLNNGLQGETFEFEERPRPGKADKFRYLTPTQQEKALEILKRHGKLKTPDAEQEAKQEAAWYLPD